MNSKHRVTTIVAAVLSLFALTGLAGNDFESWLQQHSGDLETQKEDFQYYKDSRDKEFAAFLKMQWQAVEVKQGQVRDQQPKPDVIPVAPVKAFIPDRQTAPRPPVSIVLPDAPVTEPPEIQAPASAVTIPSQGSRVDIDFYSRHIGFSYDPLLSKKINRRIDKDTIADYWSAMSITDYASLLTQLSVHKKTLRLNDWAFAALVYKLAAEISEQRHNESVLLNWFLLVKSGYRARLAYDDVQLFLLVPSKHEMFDVPYFSFGGKRFYAVAFDGTENRPGRVYTYDGEYPQAMADFDMQLTASVAAAEAAGQRRLTFEFEGKTYTIDVSYDAGRVDFLNSYPQLELQLYFASAVHQATATSLLAQLAANMQGMSEQQAVNFLLRFVQTSLHYESDDKQFGRENYLFPEETLFYAYSDCEDRAVLFAWLVTSLLQLDVIGLDYPGHVATAVSFSQPVPGDTIRYQGKAYVVADPTYINAVAGMTMPDLKRYTPRVIAY